MINPNYGYEGALVASDRAKQKLLEMIRSGELASGEKIDQRLLAKKLNLTTAPLREALSSLEAEGLVQRIPGVGIFCKAYTVDEIEDLIEIRGVLESLAAKKAAGVITDDYKKRLQELADQLSNPDYHYKREDFLKKHVEFHTLIAKISGSKNLMNMLERGNITEEVLANIAANIWPVEPHDHIEVANAICSGESELAEKTMREHIAPTFKERILKLRERYGSSLITEKKAE